MIMGQLGINSSDEEASWFSTGIRPYNPQSCRLSCLCLVGLSCTRVIRPPAWTKAVKVCHLEYFRWCEHNYKHGKGPKAGGTPFDLFV